MADSPDTAFPPPNAAALNPYAAPRAAVAAGDFAAEGAAPASRGQRLRAAIIDYMIFVVPLAAMLIPMAMSRGRAMAVVGPVLGGLVFVAILVINGMLLARNGQTIGKRSTGIRVVRTDGSDAGFTRLFFLRGGLSWLIAAIPMIGGLYALVDTLCIFRGDRRCLHDLIADTRVVEAE